MAIASVLNLSNTTPAAPSGKANVIFQNDGGTSTSNESAYMPTMVGDTGSGGTSGAVPAPPSGSAAAGDFLNAGGTWSAPSGSPITQQEQTYNYAADTGTANTYAVALTPSLAVPVAGTRVCFKAANANTGASTLALNGGSANAITKTGTTALASGDIAVNQIVELVYDGTQWQMVASAPNNSSGGSAFNAITSGTNTTATMVVGTGGSLAPSGTGTIAATSVPIAGVPASVQNASIGCIIDGAGSVPSTGTKAFVQIPFNCTITGWTVLADASGSAAIGVSKGTFSAYPTVSSIVASAPPAISSAQKATSTTLTGWTTTVTAGDVVVFSLTSVATVTRITVELLVTRS